MRKTLLSAAALTLLCVPASAQMMCGPGQQAQASPQASIPAAPGGGMMCGMMRQSAAKPESDAQKPQSSDMCPCCRNMAMMRGGGSMQHHMPGMDMPKPQ
jgi:hypothetical protein